MQKFRKLKVWIKAIEYVTFIYQLTITFPNEEKYGLVDQLRRAAVSICLNIAEGSGASTDIEFARFLRISLRSSYEIMAALEISYKLGYIDKETLNKALAGADELCAMLYSLTKTLKADV
jgi:four helix bundle protein